MGCCGAESGGIEDLAWVRVCGRSGAGGCGVDGKVAGREGGVGDCGVRGGNVVSSILHAWNI